ncbi:hypothetical protein GGS20DRAFT_570470 [Poronia punctata]|nr:hypothetical protein GGS20DRAFT_570470 [Poronia punctata]
MPYQENKAAGSGARTRDDERAEQAPIPVDSPSLSHRNRHRSETESSQTPGLLVTDDSSYCDSGYNTGFLPESPELVAEEVPPAYSEFHDQLNIHQAGFDAGAAVTGDGRVDININQTSRRLADYLAPTLINQLIPESEASHGPLPPAYIPPSLGGLPGQTPPPRLNVVIQIVGSRGDVQPFISLGQVLKNTYGHRVRIATHATFQTFVEENGLEFFAIGGDPAELMAFMVKNPGLMPGVDALKAGEITQRRKGIEQIIMGCWRSCIETGDGLGPSPRFDRGQNEINQPSAAIPVMGDATHKPFVADVIIANPPSFAHIHVAEKLGVPLHLMFTMPWSPTRAFPQPLANIQSSNTDSVTTNYLSYAMVEMMTWQGLGDVINRFRTKILDLEPLPLIWAPGVLTRLRIPYTYCWSPALIPKPNDWGDHIDIAGFYFLNLASSYTPDPELAAFLAAGPPPIYIGFGSIVVDDPDGLTKTIFEAVAETGVRALVSKGWGGLGADALNVPDGVFMLGNVPHDWLFKHVSAVCHHGGAGTTAAGIQAGKPTIIVPFFGDQPFWGAMVAKAGAGPEPIPYKSLTTSALVEAIRTVLKPDVQEKAKELGEKIREERGADVGAQCFHKHLNVDTLRCAFVPSRAAAWRVRRTQVCISAFAAATLVNNGYIRYSDLKLFRAKEYDTENYPTDPISACTSALVGDFTTILMSAADIPRDLFKAAVGTAKPKTTEDVASEDAALEAIKEGAVTPDMLGTTGSAAFGAPSHQSSDLSNVRSGSSPGPGQQRSRQSTITEGMLPGVGSSQLEKVIDSSKSINNIITTGVKSPMNFCLGLARGFRNAPNLYHDETVRPTEKVTSFQSGLKVAGKEFGLGMFDGITGLVTQPLRGAEKEGGAGLLKGFGKGIGGLILKPAAAFWSVPAYAMAGVHAEIRTLFAQSAHRYIVASRISQGNEEYKNSTAEERHDIEARWLAQQDKLKGFMSLKQKEKGKLRDLSPSPSRGPSTTGPEEKKKFQERKKEWKKRRAAGPFIEETVPLTNTHRTSHDKDDDFEAAILAAVRETSRGDTAEDARIEEAIRSSVRLARTRATTMDSHASSSSLGVSSPSPRPSWSSDVKRPLPSNNSSLASPLPPGALENITDEEYQALIEEAIKVSIAENQQQHHIQMHDLEDEGSDEGSDLKLALERSNSDTPHIPTGDREYQEVLETSRRHTPPTHDDDEEEALRRALEISQAEHTNHGDDDDDEELRRVMEESKRAHEEEQARIQSMRSEEDIVLEYVKKQSLAEATFLGQAKGKGTAADEGDENEELRRALEESMKTEEGARRGGGGGPSGLK